jgi:hypothetical protein
MQALASSISCVKLQVVPVTDDPHKPSIQLASTGEPISKECMNTLIDRLTLMIDLHTCLPFGMTVAPNRGIIVAPEAYCEGAACVPITTDSRVMGQTANGAHSNFSSALNLGSLLMRITKSLTAVFRGW